LKNGIFRESEMKKIIGLTGTYCAGKNHAAAILEKRGLPVLDVDKLGHEALEIEKEAVFARFGADLKNPDGTVNRRLLGERVFGNPVEMATLQSLVHPAANRLTEDWLAGQSGNCVINAALLHKSSVFCQLDFIILIEAPFFTRLLRARQRDRLPLPLLLRRFASQNDFYPQYLSRKADIYKVGNPGFFWRPGESKSNFRRLYAKLRRRIDEVLLGEGIL
jgi:dephospho-CoA kinase